MQGGALVGQGEHPDPAVVLCVPALDQTARGEAIDDSRDVRGVAVQPAGQVAHRHLPARLEREQGAHLRRGEVDPVTAFLETGRGFIAGNPTGTGLAFGAGLALAAVMGVWALRGLRRAEAAG